MQGIEDSQKIQVRIAVHLFESEAREYSRNDFHTFYNDEKFKKHYKIDNNEIVTLHKI